MTRLHPAALGAAFLLLGAGAVQAQETASQACYVPASGTVYVIGLTGTPTACADGHTQVTLQGPQGVPGPQGQPGASGYQIVTAEIAGTSASWLATADLACPVGKRAVGGGATTYNAYVRIFRTQPKQEDGGASWQVGLAWEPTSTPADATWGAAFAVCLAM